MPYSIAVERDILSYFIDQQQVFLVDDDLAMCFVVVVLELPTGEDEADRVLHVRIFHNRHLRLTAVAVNALEQQRFQHTQVQVHRRSTRGRAHTLLEQAHQCVYAVPRVTCIKVRELENWPLAVVERLQKTLKEQVRVLLLHVRNGRYTTVLQDLNKILYQTALLVPTQSLTVLKQSPRSRPRTLPVVHKHLVRRHRQHRAIVEKCTDGTVRQLVHEAVLVLVVAPGVHVLNIMESGEFNAQIGSQEASLLVLINAVKLARSDLRNVVLTEEQRHDCLLVWRLVNTPVDLEIAKISHHKIAPAYIVNLLNRNQSICTQNLNFFLYTLVIIKKTTHRL